MYMHMNVCKYLSIWMCEYIYILYLYTLSITTMINANNVWTVQLSYFWPNKLRPKKLSICILLRYYFLFEIVVLNFQFFSVYHHNKQSNSQQFQQKTHYKSLYTVVKMKRVLSVYIKFIFVKSFKAFLEIIYSIGFLDHYKHSKM